MDTLLKLFDGLWNLRFLTGYRTKIAQVVLGVLSGYQAVASSKDAWAAGLHFHPILLPVYLALVGYFSAKVAQFAKEHQVSPPGSGTV